MIAVGQQSVVFLPNTGVSNCQAAVDGNLTRHFDLFFAMQLNGKKLGHIEQ